MNFKVIVKKTTKPSAVRYLESINNNNIFLLKYFKYECILCQRFCSNIWVSNCDNCRENPYDIEGGVCHECCT